MKDAELDKLQSPRPRPALPAIASLTARWGVDCGQGARELGTGEARGTGKALLAAAFGGPGRARPAADHLLPGSGCRQQPGLPARPRFLGPAGDGLARIDARRPAAGGAEPARAAPPRVSHAGGDWTESAALSRRACASGR